MTDCVSTRVSQYDSPCTQRPARKRSLLQKLIDWDNKYRQMARLRDMNDQQLADIGLTRADVEKATPPEWNPPIQLR